MISNEIFDAAKSLFYQQALAIDGVYVNVLADYIDLALQETKAQGKAPDWDVLLREAADDLLLLTSRDPERGGDALFVEGIYLLLHNGEKFLGQFNRMGFSDGVDKWQTMYQASKKACEETLEELMETLSRISCLTGILYLR